MFVNLSEKLQKILKSLKGKGKLTEDNIKEALREIRLALLEGDVHYKVVKDFIESIRVQAVGSEVRESLTPGQQVVKIVYQELVRILGDKVSSLSLSSSPNLIMMVGLHGCGKTTTCAKLGNFLKKKGHNPLLVGIDVYRPAAQKQLRVLGNSLNIPVYTGEPKDSPAEILREAIITSSSQGKDVLIIDTAGRLHIDEEMMNELKKIKDEFNPQEILLVADAMIGQDAVNQALAFNKSLNLTGVILTKLDGDARGGAALSIKMVTNCPIKFIGVGEKLNALEVFHPERIASLILGMGDVLTLIEKTEEVVDIKTAQKWEKKIKKGEFDLQDFKEQLQGLKKMGPLAQLLDMIPGFSRKRFISEVEVEEKNLKDIEAMINSMTMEERHHPEIIDGSRKRRIAKGSGTSVQKINLLLKQFTETKKMLKKIGKIDKILGTID